MDVPVATVPWAGVDTQALPRSTGSSRGFLPCCDLGGLPLPNLLFSCSVMSDSLQPHGLQHTRLPCPYQLLELAQIQSIDSVMPSNQLILCHSPFLLLSIFPSSSGRRIGSSHHVAKVLEAGRRQSQPTSLFSKKGAPRSHKGLARPCIVWKHPRFPHTAPRGD